MGSFNELERGKKTKKKIRPIPIPIATPTPRHIKDELGFKVRLLELCLELKNADEGP